MATADELFIWGATQRTVQPRMLKRRMVALLLIACGGPSDRPASDDTSPSAPSASEQQSDPEPEPERPEPATAPVTVTQRCVPGQVISCRRDGTQMCLPDGSRYAECVEPEPAQAPEPEPDTEPGPAPEPDVEPEPEPEPEECTCVELEQQTVTCSKPTVACHGTSRRDEAACAAASSNEALYWANEARLLELSYPAVLSTDTYQTAPDACSLEVESEFTDPYFVDRYEPRTGCYCTVSAISCSGTQTLTRACN